MCVRILIFNVRPLKCFVSLVIDGGIRRVTVSTLYLLLICTHIMQFQYNIVCVQKKKIFTLHSRSRWSNNKKIMQNRKGFFYLVINLSASCLRYGFSHSAFFFSQRYACSIFIITTTMMITTFPICSHLFGK